MKNILISLFSIFIIFACSSTPVEKVDVQETKTVDLTENTQKDSNDSVVMSDVDLGEAYVTVLFDYDDDTLKEESLEELFAVSRLMKSNAKYTLLVEGHADERGTREYNLALGQRRAETVSDYFVLNGISKNRITVKSFGEERPAVIGQDEMSYAKNRRVEIN